MRVFKTFFVFCLLLMPAGANAEIQWLFPALDRPDASVERGFLYFTFYGTNVGTRDVPISSVGVSCRCLTVKTDKMVVKPGEGVVLSVRMNTFGLYGHQKKTISISSGGMPDTPSVLTVEAELPPKPRISILGW